jgi:thiol:disulfide interchange protein DsbC
MKKAVKEREDIAFYIKLFPVGGDPESLAKSEAIVCAGSLRLLEDAFDGRHIPAASCGTTAVEENIRLAEKLGITGTPTIVLPDGALLPGYKDAETLVRYLEEAGRSAEAEGLQETERAVSEAVAEAVAEASGGTGPRDQNYRPSY